MIFKDTLIVFFLATASVATAAEFRIEGRPGALQELIYSGSIAPGDRIVLGPGRHGSVEIVDLQFDKPVTLEADRGKRPILDRLEIRKGAGWRIEGLVVIPGRGDIDHAALVSIKQGQDIVLDRLTVASAENSNGWTAEAWRRKARTGINVSGRDITIRNSLIRNVKYGISSNADGARIENNTIELFSGDGIRGLGDDSSYIGNTIDTCIAAGDDHHDDGFQSWSTDSAGRPGRGEVRNVRVEGNLIKNGNHPLTCTLQGIGLFDGIYEDWIIRGNTVIVDHWHGITVMGAIRVKVLENTVVDANHNRPGPPWVTITAHKDGRLSVDSIIAHNVFQPWAGGRNSRFSQPQPGVQLYGNRTVPTPEDAIAVGR